MDKKRRVYSVGNEMPLEEIMKGISLGTVMYKVRSAKKCLRRKYEVDIQNMRLSYSPSKKPFWKGKLTNACKCASMSQFGSNVVDLFDLEEVRTGCNSDVFNQLEARFRRRLQAQLHPRLRSIVKEENCFSLVVAPSHSIVDLIAPNIHTRDAWVRGLRQLIACCRHLRVTHDEERWLKDHVKRADVNGNGCLSFNECLGLLEQMNIQMRRKEAKKLFEAANFRKVKIDGDDALEPDEFVQFYRSLVHRPELEEIMKKYSVSNSAFWGTEELQNFLKTEQNMHLSRDHCEGIIEEYEPEKNKISGYLSLVGFEKMMLSMDQHIFNKNHRIIYQDMTHPLSHYYISSSHNTYLLSGQLVGESSIEGYIQALKRGCRCLELDIWDGPDGEPIIFHGYTLTTRIYLRDVLEAIKRNGFRASQYPIILSIENHCSIPYQERMAEHFKNILGEYLYQDSVESEETNYPSPESLARKIFIKGKKLQTRNDPNTLSAPVEDTEDSSDDDHETEIMAVMVDHNPNVQKSDAPVAKRKVFQGLSDLVNLFCAKKFKSFAECRIVWNFCDMASFSETHANSLSSVEGTDFVTHNRRHMSRIYPKGTRTDSCNYDPIPFWNTGCQLVALNYQTWDENMYIYEAKFTQNGKCGFVLKPKYLIDSAPYDPSKSPYPDMHWDVTIKIISAQFLPKPKKDLEGEVVDPYVSIEVVGHTMDAQKSKTKVINNNGFNPVWNETLKFKLDAPEEAIFFFKVKDADVLSDEFIGQYALPFTSINEGYRHVHLEDERGNPLGKATVFVHVSYKQVVSYRKQSAAV